MINEPDVAALTLECSHGQVRWTRSFKTVFGSKHASKLPAVGHTGHSITLFPTSSTYAGFLGAFGPDKTSLEVDACVRSQRVFFLRSCTAKTRGPSPQPIRELPARSWSSPFSLGLCASLHALSASPHIMSDPDGSNPYRPPVAHKMHVAPLYPTSDQVNSMI